MMIKEKYKEDNIFYYIEILKKWRKFILLNVSIITLLSIIIAFILPEWFHSTASIKPSENTGVSLFSAVLANKGLASLGKNLNIGGLQYSDLDYYNSLLISRRITTVMIEKFDLKNVYDQEYQFKTIKALLDNSTFETDPTSNIFILGVYDKDPKRSQEMVQEYLRLLKQNIMEFNGADLKFNREFIEKRLKSNEEELKNAEDNLKEFQLKYGVIVPEEQFIATIKTMAEIEAQKLFLETQIATVKHAKGSDSPEYQTINQQIVTIEKKINGLKRSKNNSNDFDFLISLGNAPKLINMYVRLFRDVEIQATLFEYIIPLFEQAKMQEELNAPPFNIIDTPNLPEYKAKPKKAIIIIASFFFAVLFSIFYVVIFEHIKKLKDSKIA